MTPDLMNLLDKIDKAAEDGQNGSAAYALDRLRLIRELAQAFRLKVERDGSVRCPAVLARRQCELSKGHIGQHSLCIGDRS